MSYFILIILLITTVLHLIGFGGYIATEEHHKALANIICAIIYSIASVFQIIVMF